MILNVRAGHSRHSLLTAVVHQRHRSLLELSTSRRVESGDNHQGATGIREREVEWSQSILMLRKCSLFERNCAWATHIALPLSCYYWSCGIGQGCRDPSPRWGSSRFSTETFQSECLWESNLANWNNWCDAKCFIYVGSFCRISETWSVNIKWPKRAKENEMIKTQPKRDRNEWHLDER